MTGADDALFGPLSGSSGGTGSVRLPLVTSGILIRPDSYSVDINRAFPKLSYQDAASHVMDSAVRAHNNMYDMRNPPNFPAGSVGVPRAALHLAQIVDRFYDGEETFWVSCPNLTAPKMFTFTGRFGFLKVWRFAQQIPNRSQFSTEWYWLDTTEGQLSAVEIGVLVGHPKLRLHHPFVGENDARTYYTS